MDCVLPPRGDGSDENYKSLEISIIKGTKLTRRICGHPVVAATCKGLSCVLLRPLEHTGLEMGLSMFSVDGLALSLVPVVEVNISWVLVGDPGAGGESSWGDNGDGVEIWENTRSVETPGISD